MNRRGQARPSADEVWRAYQELEGRTGDRDYGSTVEHFRKLGCEGVDYAYVWRACEWRRLRRDGMGRLGHHLGKLLLPRYWFSCWWTMEMRLKGVRLGRGVYCKGRVDVERRGGHIQVGRRVEFGKYVLLQTAPGGELRIGDEVQINRFNILSAGMRIEVEDYCVFAPYVRIVDSEYRFREREALIKNTAGRSEPVKIGRGTWLGFGVTVLKGVEIGEGAVVGANAVVRESVPPFAIAAGVPARIIGYRA